MRPELKRVATLTPYPQRAGGIVTYVSAQEFLYGTPGRIMKGRGQAA